VSLTRRKARRFGISSGRARHLVLFRWRGFVSPVGSNTKEPRKLTISSVFCPRLALSHNALTSLSSSFLLLTRLRYLNLKGNDLREWPPVVRSTRLLSHLRKPNRPTLTSALVFPSAGVSPNARDP
jgi:hypothetical protein